MRRSIPETGQRNGWRTLLLGLLLLMAGGVLAHRLWRAHEQNRMPLPGDVSAGGPCTVWFVGSSSFAYWDALAADLRPWRAINRGVADADIPRLLARWDRQGRFARPAAIVLYAGENDIDRERDADRVATDYGALLNALSSAMPGVPVIAMAIKPSPARWPEHDEQLHLNSKIRRLTAGRPLFHYLDANIALMPNGQFGPYYWDDGIHLNEVGHRMWAEAIRGDLARNVPGAGGACSR